MIKYNFKGIYISRETHIEILKDLDFPETFFKENPEQESFYYNGILFHRNDFPPSKFQIGDKIFKPKGYKFPGTVVSVFKNLAGETRVVAELEDNGMLHIFSESQLEKNTISQ